MSAQEDFDDAVAGWELAKLDVQMFNRRAEQSRAEVERYYRAMMRASREMHDEREKAKWGAA